MSNAKLRAFAIVTIPAVVSFAYACGDEGAGSVATDAGAEGATSPDDASGDVAEGTSGALWRSGTRLRAEVLRAGEAERFAAFFDTARGERCMMRSTKDGIRCLPDSLELLYDDADCKTPVATRTGGCRADVKYVVEQESSGLACAPLFTHVSRVWSRGADIPARDAFAWSADGCIPAPTTGGTYSALGAEVPLTEFVRAATVREDVTPTIARARYQAEDGSELVTGDLVDVGRDAGCRMTGVGAPDARKLICSSRRTAYADLTNGPFADVGCETSAGVDYTKAECPPPDLIERAERVDAGLSTCGSQTAVTLYGVGAEVTGYHGSPGACVPRSVPGERYFALGPAVDPATFPPLERATFGNGRARVDALSSAGVRLDVGGFFDDARKTGCFPSDFTDGKQYCVTHDTHHIGTGGPGRFKDPGCTQPLGLVSVCSPAPYFFTVGVAGSCVLNDVMGYEVGAKVEIAQYWTMAETCTGPIAVDPSEVYYELGAQVPVSSKLLEVTRVRE